MSFLSGLFKRGRRSQEGEKLTYQRVGPNEVQIIYEEEGICREGGIARVVTRGTYEPWGVNASAK